MPTTSITCGDFLCSIGSRCLDSKPSSSRQVLVDCPDGGLSSSPRTATLSPWGTRPEHWFCQPGSVPQSSRSIISLKRGAWMAAVRLCGGQDRHLCHSGVNRISWLCLFERDLLFVPALLYPHRSFPGAYTPRLQILLASPDLITQLKRLIISQE